MKEKTWKEQTIEWLNTKKPQPPEIAKATNLHIKFVQRLKVDKVPDPGVDKVNKVYNYLKRRK